MDTETWRWIWLVAAVVFAIGEISSAGSFFLAPFAAGAIISTALAFLGVNVAIQWVAFVVVSGGSFAALRPLVRRLDRNEPTEGIGAKRLIGEEALVLETIPADRELGMIRVHREEWRAESGDGSEIPEKSRVKVVEIRGTRAIVFPLRLPDRESPPAIEADKND